MFAKAISANITPISTATVVATRVKIKRSSICIPAPRESSLEI